jgi:hypothetical protein
MCSYLVIINYYNQIITNPYKFEIIHQCICNNQCILYIINSVFVIINI